MNMPGQYAPPHHEDDMNNNIRYGHIPQRVPRRNKTLKRVECVVFLLLSSPKLETHTHTIHRLFHGNFVLDSAVPTKLLNLCAYKDEREFTHMRYSAATGDPNDFKDNGFTLRQVHYDPPRRTELFIVMTMYNEDDTLFARTMHGVMKNIAYLCKRDRSKTWGKDGWKKVVICIVSDGRQKINSRTLSAIAAIGAYQDGIAKNVVNGKPVAAHIYEYTTQSTSALVHAKPCPIFNTRKYKSLSPSPIRSRAQRRELSRCRLSSVSRRRIRRKSTRTAGSSMPLDRFFSRTFASFWTSARDLAQARSTIFGRHSTSTRM